MKPIALIIAAILICHSAHAGEPLALDRIYSPPNLEGVEAFGFDASPDGQSIAYLRADAATPGHYDLWLHNLASNSDRRLLAANDIAKNQQVSAEQWATNQRLRLDARGIVDYGWSPDGTRLLIPLYGDLYLYYFATGQVSRLTSTPGAELNPGFSPGGRYISYVRDGDLYLFDLDKNRETKLTKREHSGVRYGVADFIAAEQMHRFTGYWWSPDGRSIAVIETDERPLAGKNPVLLFADGPRQAENPYPQAGGANVKSRLLIIDLTRGRQYKVKLSSDDEYIARVGWFPDGQNLLVVTQSRDQRHLWARAFNNKGGNARLLASESSDTWVNLHNDFYLVAQSHIFIWGSERDGYNRLYAIDWDGAVLGALTPPAMIVDRLVSVDRNRGRLYIEGYIDDPLEKNLYSLDLDPATDDKPLRLTTESGWHSTAVLLGPDVIVDRFSDPVTPTSVALRNLDGSIRSYIADNHLKPARPYAPYSDHHIAPAFGTLAAADGTVLHYRLYQPASPGPHPVIIHIYGGPGLQMVNRAWAPLWHQAALAKGFAVFTLDNRGSSRRGVAFESVLKGRLGKIEVEDQLRGIEFLKSQALIDPKRIALYGWSYGGYLALKTAEAAGGGIDVVIAGAPVTDWRLYDTHYTERYLGLPQDNRAGYDASSVFADIDRLKARLLLIHGLADDNVLFAHSTRLMAALQTRDVSFDLMVYPGSGHRLGQPLLEHHLYTTIFEFLERQPQPR